MCCLRLYVLLLLCVLRVFIMCLLGIDRFLKRFFKSLIFSRNRRMTETSTVDGGVEQEGQEQQSIFHQVVEGDEAKRAIIVSIR